MPLSTRSSTYGVSISGHGQLPVSSQFVQFGFACTLHPGTWVITMMMGFRLVHSHDCIVLFAPGILIVDPTVVSLQNDLP
jgi:hypothetical protein